MDNVKVARYDIMAGSKVVGSSPTTDFTVTDLMPNTEYFFTIVARDAAGNQSPASEPLVVTTLVQVDDFEDSDLLANGGWGVWRTSCDGEIFPNGVSTLKANEPGYPDDEGFAVRLDYEVGAEGEWAYCNFFLDFDNGAAVDLTQSNVIGVQFNMRGMSDTVLSLLLGTPLAQYNWFYYSYELRPTPDWTVVRVKFDQFVADSKVPYTIEEALQNANSLVWEDSNMGHDGWFMIDNVDFVTTANELSAPSSAATENLWTVLLLLLVSLSVGLL
jgi:hypothetical protein